MRCPKCGGRYLEVHGCFSGTQKIQWRDPALGYDDDEFTVLDSEPTDFEWDDHDTVDCLDCGHSDSAVEFAVPEED